MSAHIATGPAPGTFNDNAAQKRHTGGVQSRRNSRLRTAAIFSDHMVLQRRQSIPVFGTAAAHSIIYVSLISPAAELEKITCTADSAGNWLALLPPHEASGPYTLSIRSDGELYEFKDVLIGEVWIASGQSNMELPLTAAAGGEEMLRSFSDTDVRYYATPKHGIVDDTLLDLEGASTWSACTGGHFGDMSAVAFYYARQLRERIGNVPIGIIDCYVGGTSISCWMSEESLQRLASGRGYLDRYQTAIQGKSEATMRTETAQWQEEFNAWNENIAAAQTQNPTVDWSELIARFGYCPWPPPVTSFSQYRPTGPFQAMVSRIAPYGARGVLWYQGEEDEAYAADYAELLEAMVHEWRRLWRVDNHQLVFFIAQLPQYIDEQDYTAGNDRLLWPILRQAQWQVAQKLPDTIGVCLFDCGEFNNIHPTDKKTVGERMANLAMTHIYGVSAQPRALPDFPEVQEITEISAQHGHGALRIRLSHSTGLHWAQDDFRIHARANQEEDIIETQQGVATHKPDTTIVPAAYTGFEITGEDGIFYPAHAWITPTGDICVASDDVPTPLHIRYGWYSWGPAALVNGAGLPVVPFIL
ncbi:sialate O-acetylesterase [Alloscardovia criceti]|uniref:sialate O-acetylesterase n=1 Tax=Alloscardovia criceti TaxID=356828 RepID=UPI000379A738|nr:sialate O-acetylesterase [Alloscardovia criceti]